MTLLQIVAACSTIFGVFGMPLVTFAFLWMRRVTKVMNTVEARSRELEHNGGNSMKDMAREAKEEATRASAAASALSADVAALRTDIVGVRAANEVLGSLLTQLIQRGSSG